MPPPTAVIVRVSINAEKTEATFTGLRLPSPPLDGDTFFVNHGDTLEWELQDESGRPLKGGRFQLRFSGFPNEADKRPLLLNTKEVVEANRRVIRGAVNTQALKGRYRYALVNQETNKGLVCLWGVKRLEMVGGEDSGGP